MVGYFYLQKRALVLSEAAFANHRPVSPTRNWVEVRKERVKKTSWVRLLVGGAILIGLAVLFYPYKDSTDYYRYGWFGYFGFIAIIWVRNVLLKASLAFGESD